MNNSKDSSMGELEDFLHTLKIHNKYLDACFNDAVAVHHLKQLTAKTVIEELKGLRYDPYQIPLFNWHDVQERISKWEEELKG